MLTLYKMGEKVFKDELNSLDFMYPIYAKSVTLIYMNIQITDLSRMTREVELSKLFTAYGTVSSTTIVMDKKTRTSKGFGFVVMPNEKEALLAIKELHKSKVNGQKMTVKKAKDKE